MQVDPKGLLPCPFCGSSEVSPSAWDVKCSGCGAEMPGGTERAIATWNRRAYLSAAGGKAEPAAWRYRDAWGDWAYCQAVDNVNGPTVFTEKQPLYLHPQHEPAAVEPAVEASPSDGWQPIETAPMDGTWLDLWAGDRRIPDVHWSDTADPDVYGATDGWVDSAGRFVVGEDETPQFWMRVERPSSVALQTAESPSHD